MIHRLRRRAARRARTGRDPRQTGVAAAGASLWRSRYRSARRRLAYRRVQFSLLATALLLLGLLAWPFTRTHLQALAVLKTVSGEALPPLLRSVATEPLAVSSTTLGTSAGPVRARLYAPRNHPEAPGLVVFHGVHHLGMDEPRLVTFAAAMAGCGLNVLTPELPDIKDYRVGERSVEVIGQSATWFAQSERQPVGVMGLSFSGGLALVAAADARFRPSMKLVFAVGSQGAMDRVASYYRTGQAVRPDGSVELLPAHEYGPLVLEYEHVEEFVPAADTAAIRDVLRAHLYEDKDAEASAMKHLSPAQQVEALHLMDAGSSGTRALLETSSQRHRSEMDGLSPEAHLRDITTPVFLLHGEADNIIPAPETLWMASELRPAVLQAALVSPVLSHLDMAKKPSMLDELRLVHFMALVLHAAEHRG